MKVSRRIAVIKREFNRFSALAALRASRKPESIRAAPSFRPLTAGEAEVILGAGLWTALSDARRRA